MAKKSAIKFPNGNALKYFALLVREMYSLYSYAKCFLWKHGFTPLHFAHNDFYYNFTCERNEMK